MSLLNILSALYYEMYCLKVWRLRNGWLLFSHPVPTFFVHLSGEDQYGPRFLLKTFIIKGWTWVWIHNFMIMSQCLTHFVMVKLKLI